MSIHSLTSDWLDRLFPARVIRRQQREEEENQKHPERLAVLPYCREGRGVDIGCGHRKTHQNCIGVDITPKGQKGSVGNVAGRPSCADVCASGDQLTMFGDGELDFVVSRHNLEHYVDVIKTLREWKRVLRSGGIMALVLPDERCRNTIEMDPTHKHVFTPESLDAHLEAIGGFRTIKTEPVVPDWSFLHVSERVAE